VRWKPSLTLIWELLLDVSTSYSVLGIYFRFAVRSFSTSQRQFSDIQRGMLIAHSGAGATRMREEVFVSFGLFMVGFIVLMFGLGIGAYLLHVPPQWIGVGELCLAGLGILMGVTATRGRDPSN
jgi:hypothetical protein